MTKILAFINNPIMEQIRPFYHRSINSSGNKISYWSTRSIGTGCYNIQSRRPFYRSFMFDSRTYTNIELVKYPHYT